MENVNGCERSAIRKLGLFVTCVTVLHFAPVEVRAVPPVDALDTPSFSFRLGSPTLDDDLHSASVLQVRGSNPVESIDAATLGLLDIDDEIDALSEPLESLPDTFVFLFSVDAASVGSVAPDPVASEAGVPYNAFDQASRGQQAGDLFVSCTVFEYSAMPSTFGPKLGSELFNNVLVTNNYDEGGVDFSALPKTSAADSALSGTRQDGVDAAAHLTSTSFFFSLSSSSPSLQTASPQRSGADVLYYSGATGETSVYAKAATLGLTQDDDIDALLVLDTDGDGVFSQADVIAFSLSRLSPSLASTINAGSADLLLGRSTSPPEVVATAEMLGLNGATDNIDALEFDACADSLGYAADHGIRSHGSPPDVTEPAGIEEPRKPGRRLGQP